MKKYLFYFALTVGITTNAQFAPQADQPGTTAIHKDSSIFVGWAVAVYDFQRGPQDISAGATPLVDFGDSTAALGVAEGTSTDVVSLGDGGHITLRFTNPIGNGTGPDFAVFENSFSHTFIELAHVEVSTDGNTFVRIPSQSMTQTTTQVGGFGSVNCEEIHNLAGKYIGGYGTPFDLEDIADSTGIDVDSIAYVRIIDVVGSIDPAYGTTDALGNYINEPFPTPFGSGGFDLDAVGVINEYEAPEPITTGLDQLHLEVALFPNPTNDLLNIKFQGEHEVTIHDMSGRVLYAELIDSEVQISMQEVALKNGVYIVRVGSISKRVILRN